MFSLPLSPPSPLPLSSLGLSFSPLGLCKAVFLLVSKPAIFLSSFTPTEGETPVFADLPPCVEACDLALCRSWRSSSHPSRRGWLKEALFYLSSGDAPLTVQAISTTIRLPFNHRLLVQNLTFLVNMADIECSMTTMMSDNDDERVLFIIRLVYVFILFWLR